MERKHTKRNFECTVKGTVALIEERIDFLMEKFRAELADLKPDDYDEIFSLKHVVSTSKELGRSIFKRDVRHFLETFGTFDKSYTPNDTEDWFYFTGTANIEGIAACEAWRRLTPEIELRLKSLGHPLE